MQLWITVARVNMRWETAHRFEKSNVLRMLQG